MNWQTKEQLTDLLISLVQHGSVTLSDEENRLSSYIYYQLQQLPFFEKYPELLQQHRMEDGRSFVTGLVKQSAKSDTIILLSHFDVVGVEDYGVLKDLAFQPLELTRELHNHLDSLPEEAKEHLLTGDWLFGRGTMDMKAGLTVQMGMLEKAIQENWDVNLLLLAVPDEEVNSKGMLQSLPALRQLATEHNLNYLACVNSEPMFQQYPGDDNLYLYTGSIGKLLPGFFCYGKETHVGEPLAGLNANLMVSEIHRLLELNVDLCEEVSGEVTPPPSNLIQKDLKTEYSVQIPHTAVTLFNVLFMKKSLQQWKTEFIQIARQAAVNIEEHMNRKINEYARFQAFSKPEYNVSVYTYEELLAMAKEKHGDEEINSRIAGVILANAQFDEREQSIKVVEELASLCRDEAPMIVLFFAPPFYPAVATEEEDEFMRTAEEFIYDWKNHGVNWAKQVYFSGLCDLSFVGKANLTDHQLLEKNTPIYDHSFSLPFDDMKSLQMPTFNLGPVGKDPHQWTERLNVQFSFGEFPKMLEDLVKRLAKVK